MAYDIARLEQALVNADKAGDVDAAKAFATEIRKMRAAPQEPKPSALGRPDDTLQVWNPATLISDKARNFDTGINIGADTSNYFAGAGKGFVDLGRRAKQALGFISEKDVDEIKNRDAALMDTKAGIFGNMTGKVLATLPALAIPGVNTAIGSTALGSGMGAMELTGTGDSTLKNTVMSGLLGFGGHQLGAKIIPGAINRAKSSIASLASQKTANAARDSTIAASRNAGYVLPRSEVKPTAVSNLLEKWAGKASVAQQASITNQQVTNKLVRESLGLTKDAPITPEALDPIKKAAWGIYDQVKNVGTLTTDKAYKDSLKGIAKKFNGLSREFPELGNAQIDDLVKGLSKSQISSEGAVEAIKSLRYQANTNLNPMNMNPAAKALGKAQKAAADELEGLIERHLDPKTLGSLLKDFRNARVTLAKVGTVEKSMNSSTGDVSARVLGRELAKGKPLTGGLADAGRFAQAFPRYVQQNVNPIQGGSPLDAAVAAVGSGAGMATGSPGVAGTAIGYALGRPAARRMALSSMLAGKPNYSPSTMARIMSNVPDTKLTPATLRILAPSIYAAQQ